MVRKKVTKAQGKTAGYEGLGMLKFGIRSTSTNMVARLDFAE